MTIVAVRARIKCYVLRFVLLVHQGVDDSTFAHLGLSDKDKSHLSVYCAVQKFKIELEDQGLGIVRACADVIGAALQSASVLPRLAATFKDAESLAGLTLKLKKRIFLLADD